MITCPICGSEADTLPMTGDAEGYDCHLHGKYKVSGSALSSTPYQTASREQWEQALSKAKTRAKTGEWPVVITDDF
jgi:hypothetical protein